jgi:hypothetical protein
MPNLIGKSGRLFGEQQPGSDEVSFKVDNTSEQYYNSPYHKQHQNQVLPIPSPRLKPPPSAHNAAGRFGGCLFPTITWNFAGSRRRRSPAINGRADQCRP